MKTKFRVKCHGATTPNEYVVTEGGDLLRKEEDGNHSRVEHGEIRQRKINIEHFTGLIDRNGVEIYENDIVLIYPQLYETKEIVKTGEFIIVYEDITKPLPSPDVVYAKGKVYWCETMLAWMVELTWLNESWKTEGGSLASIHLGGKVYAFEVAGEMGEDNN